MTEEENKWWLSNSYLLRLSMLSVSQSLSASHPPVKGVKIPRNLGTRGKGCRLREEGGARPAPLPGAQEPSLRCSFEKVQFKENKLLYNYKHHTLTHMFSGLCFLHMTICNQLKRFLRARPAPTPQSLTPKLTPFFCSGVSAQLSNPSESIICSKVFQYDSNNPSGLLQLNRYSTNRPFAQGP